MVQLIWYSIAVHRKRNGWSDLNAVCVPVSSYQFHGKNKTNVSKKSQ
uniref:Uncharacterized protein n=1 Tax=Anguilla anguilla TaxID=7936 RepID=A0A0E9WC95_ANGAN